MKYYFNLQGKLDHLAVKVKKFDNSREEGKSQIYGKQTINMDNAYG